MQSTTSRDKWRNSVEIISTTISSNTFGYSRNGLAHRDVIVNPPVGASNYEVRLKYANTDPSKEKYMGVRLSLTGSPTTITSTDGGTTWVPL